MTAYSLDTSALLSLRDDEPGAARVAELLEQAQAGTVRCFGSFMSLMEVLYRVWRNEGEPAGRLAYEQCLALPVAWTHETPDLLKRAAAIRATCPLSVADAWIAASAIEQGDHMSHSVRAFGAEVRAAAGPA